MPHDADRHLLFGLLALQTGLIRQAQLVAAFRDWARDKARPLADHLVALGHLTAAQRPVVEALAKLHLDAHGGDTERSLAAIPAGPAAVEGLTTLADPDLASTIAHLAHRSTEADAGRTAAPTVGTVTSGGQRFRILRPHARGGLGAVFVALDEELHREVALKQILDRHADDPVSRARFLLEAEITGGLEHPGIVPVYGLGTYADGRPYYAMRFVRGDSLREVVDRFHADASPGSDPGRRSLEWRRLLRRFTDVCNAIEYAHSRGVLHRDIKPGNIIVGKHGETLVVDWGLAKAVGRVESGIPSGEETLVPSSASGSAETLPGSTLGTPSYMSPEQAEGDLDRLGTRSDVYSLGATLYDLLTGRPPVEGKVHDVIRAVRRGEFPAPRQLDAAIDPALEAVCLKAMALRPDDRYASPKAMAEDVERWMADEPVSAWREPISRRMRRWARRNRTPVATAAAAMLAGVVGLAAVVVVQARARADIARALDRETRANEELVRSKAAVQARYDLAVEAIKTFHTGVSEDFLLKEERFKALRDRLLKSAADFYGKLGALLGRETDPASRRALAQANFEVADLTARVGRDADAMAAHRAVLARREAMAAEPGADPEVKADVGRSLTAVARLLESTGRTAEAEAAYREAEGRLAGLSASSPSARAALAACRSRLGWLLASTGRPADALAAYRLARADQEATAAAPGATSEARAGLAFTIGRIALLLVQMGRPAEAEAEHRTALSILQGLADHDPDVAEFRSSLALGHHNLGVLLAQTGQSAKAEAEYRAALAILRKLVADNPAVADFRDSLAIGHNNLGLLLTDTGRPAEAEAEHRQARSLYRELADDHPAVTSFRNEWATSHNYLGWVLWQSGRPSEAQAEYRAALAILQRLADDHPDVSEFRVRLADSHARLGDLFGDAGKPAEAEAEHRKALALRQELAGAHPSVTPYQRSLADSLLSIGWHLAEAGRDDEALAHYAREEAVRRALATAGSATPGDRNSLANCLTNTADLLRKAGRRDEAMAACRRARALREPLVKEHPQVSAYRAGLAETELRAGQGLLDMGDPAGAAAAWSRAVALFDGLAPPTGERAFLRAGCHAGLAGLAARPGSGVSAAEGLTESDRAMTWVRRAVALGYRNPDAYRTEDAFDPLRDRDDFRLLMMDLAMPADPFAPR